MKVAIVIPIHNEATHVEKMLDSLFGQSLNPTEVIIVDDHSTDQSHPIITKLIQNHSNVKCVISNANDGSHLPGPKVVNAFYQGLKALELDYDVICKFDGDIVLPQNYLERIAQLFASDPEIGMAGGLLFIQKDSKLVYETIASKHHLRGPIKAYRKACFDDIQGIKPVLGWDTIDVLQAQFRGWKIMIDPSLEVKHLKPTGTTYDGDSRFNLGQALYNMRTGWLLATLSAAKLTIVRKKPKLFFNSLWGYFKAYRAKQPPILSKKEGQFVKKFRWKKLLSRLFC